MRRWVWLLLLTCTSSLGAGDGPRRPRLSLRASPRMAFGPVSVLTTAELVGGEAHEDYYCPSLEWDWGDGSRSAHETDCVLFTGSAALERFFRAEHTYRQAGQFDIRLTLRRASKPIAVATASVSIRPGLAGN